MDAASLVIWLLAAALGVVAYFRPGKLHREGIRIAKAYILAMMPRIIMAFLVSGFFSVIVPTELVATWLGKESGLKGILMGSLVGGFTPGGPIICFPIVVVLLRNGAGIPPLVAFLTSLFQHSRPCFRRSSCHP